MLGMLIPNGCGTPNIFLAKKKKEAEHTKILFRIKLLCDNKRGDI